MTEMLLGALGALLMLAILGGSFALGWSSCQRMKLRRKQTEEKEMESAERKRMMEEHKAFQQLLNYNVETAYGMNGKRLEEEGDLS